MDKNQSQKKIGLSSFVSKIEEGLSFSDYFDDSVPYDVKPVHSVTPMQEDDYPIQAKNLFAGLWESDTLQGPYNQFWLDKDGQFHATQDHINWASEWMKKHGVKPGNLESRYEVMYRHGFIRVWKSSIERRIHFQYGYRNSTTIYKPNHKQLAALKNAAIELGLELYDDLSNRFIDLDESLMLEDVLKNATDYWLDKNGRFYRAASGHVEWGRQHLLSQGIPWDIGDESSVYDYMFELQFIRVKIDSQTIYFEHSTETPPTNIQMRNLKDSAIESEMKLIDTTYGSRSIELFESTFDPENDSSYWLDPHGKFHDVGYEGHTPFAAQYLSRNNISVETHRGYYEAMYKLGWVRIYVDDDSVYISHDPSREPNNAQWRSIRDAAAEFNREIFDDTTKRSIELQEGKGGRQLFIEHMMPEDIETFKSHLAQLFAHLKEELQLRTVPKVKLVEDEKNASKVLGKTAYYDPDTKTVVLYTTNRHQKDILRSFAHEVIHHWQHENEKLQTSSKDGASENGESPRPGAKDPQYAQNNPWLRQMEKQAYLLGNILFRDWEDNKKAKDRKSAKKMVEKTMLIGKQYPPKKADYRG